MQPLTLILANLLLLAAPADKPAAPSLDVDEIIEQVSSLEPAKQQEWLRRLKFRLDRATSLTLSPDAAAKKKAEFEAKLRQKMISRDTLRELIRLADTREKTAIDVLTRRYRVQIYETFWSKQEEYTERQAVLERALETWNASGKTPAQQEQMLVWLDGALKSALPDAKDPLPADLKLDGVASVDDGSKKKDSDEKPATEKPTTEKPATEKPATEKPTTEKPATEKPATEKPATEKPKEAKPADTSLRPNRAPESLGGPHLPPAIDDAPAPRIAAANPRPSADTPRVELPGPQPSESPAVAPARELLAAVRLEPSLGSPVLLENTSLEELAGAKATVAYRPNARGVPQPPLQLVAVELAADASGSALPPVVSPPRHAVLNGRAYVGPLPDEPGRGIGRELLLPLDSLTAVQVPPEPLLPPVQVNVVNLKSRIAGCNLSLRELEIELDAERDWDAMSLAPLLERLRDLRQQQNDLAAIRELMPAAEQDRVGRFESLKLAISQLGRRIFEARTRAGDDKSARTPAVRQAELDRLDALSRELARLAP